MVEPFSLRSHGHLAARTVRVMCSPIPDARRQSPIQFHSMAFAQIDAVPEGCASGTAFIIDADTGQSCQTPKTSRNPICENAVVCLNGPLEMYRQIRF